MWRNYSYTIILVVFSLLAICFVKINVSSSPDQYITITVMEGESLWGISEKYEDNHGLSKEQFVKWVEKHNGISGDVIFAGEDLVIPIKMKSMETMDVQNLASK
jgi:LysM repeat protein